MILTGKHLSFYAGHKALLKNIDVGIEAGTFTAIIGPNGAGKTTLLTIIDGDNKPNTGSVTFNQQALVSIDRLELAKQRAVLPQLGQVPFAIIAKDIISLGREPYRYTHLQQYNEEVIQNCLTQMGITDLAHNPYATLSGGEQHRVQIARTLAQIYHQPNADLSGKILFLDEPTNHLDIHHQYSLMYLLKQLQQQGLTVIAVMHDLALTLQFAEHIILLRQGQKVGHYSPHTLVQSNDLSDVYEMDMKIRWDKEEQRYILLPRLRG